MNDVAHSPSPQEVIEAQLHLLLAGRDTMDVTRALQNVLHKHHKQIAVISLSEAEIMSGNLKEAHNHLILIDNLISGRGVYTGKSIPSILQEAHGMVAQANTNVTYARNQLAHSTYEARKYANDGKPVFTV